MEDAVELVIHRSIHAGGLAPFNYETVYFGCNRIVPCHSPVAKKGLF
ncbi:hypothetical protein [Neobacillus vireti]|nr:hypothetical protein [Neobacillus vireti]